jgi:hypothetical protein
VIEKGKIMINQWKYKESTYDTNEYVINPLGEENMICVAIERLNELEVYKHNAKKLLAEISSKLPPDAQFKVIDFLKT